MNNLFDVSSHHGHSFLDELHKLHEKENCHEKHPHHFDVSGDALSDSLRDALHKDDLLKSLDDHHSHVSDSSGFLNLSDSDDHHPDASDKDDLLKSPDHDEHQHVWDSDNLLKSYDSFDAGLHGHVHLSGHVHSSGLETDQTDSGDPHAHLSILGSDWFDPDHHIHHDTYSSQITHRTFSSSSSTNNFVTIGSNTGYVYHNNDDNIGYIKGHSIYNASDWNCGYWTNEGKIYDANDNLQGWVDTDGHLYVKGKNGDVELYHTRTGGVTEGAAYLLLVWCNGQTHS